MILTGSNDILEQFDEFAKKNIPDARVTIKKIGKYSSLYVYSDTARALKCVFEYSIKSCKKYPELVCPNPIQFVDDNAGPLVWFDRLFLEL